MIGNPHCQSAGWRQDRNVRGGPGIFYAESRAGAATCRQQISRRFYRCLSAQNRVHITAIERRRNGGSLNGGRRVKPLSGGHPAGFRRVRLKSRYSRVLPSVWGRWIIDALWPQSSSVCMDIPSGAYCFSPRRCRRFCKRCFTCLSSLLPSS